MSFAVTNKQLVCYASASDKAYPSQYAPQFPPLPPLLEIYEACPSYLHFRLPPSSPQHWKRTGAPLSVQAGAQRFSECEGRQCIAIHTRFQVSGKSPEPGRHHQSSSRQRGICKIVRFLSCPKIILDVPHLVDVFIIKLSQQSWMKTVFHFPLSHPAPTPML